MGTSIDLGWALDRERDVLLAFKQNGELLTPDHGFPLRTLLPGCIGGRMIKWLSSIWVSRQHQSSNHSSSSDVLSVEHEMWSPLDGPLDHLGIMT